jgi:tight adherence protein B
MMNLILIGAFLTVVLLIIGIYILFFSARIDTLSRLEKYTIDENAHIETAKLENNSERKHLFKIFSVFGKFLPQSRYLKKKRKKLIQAAVLMKPEEFLGASLLNAVALTFLFYCILKSIIVSLVFLPIGFIIPDLIVGSKKSKRSAKISAQLPEALNVISNGLRAGFSFTQAIGIVTKEITGPISEEFNKVLRDNILGKPLEEALTNMSERTDDEDLDMVITVFIIQRQVGGNLAEVLDTISHTIRERVKIKNDVKTLTAQGKISGIIVSLLPFALAIALSIISPGYLNVLFTTLIGRLMIIVGITLQLIGIFILTKLVDIKV